MPFLYGAGFFFSIIFSEISSTPLIIVVNKNDLWNSQLSGEYDINFHLHGK